MKAIQPPLGYTANQPLCLGGQIYMYNRYLTVDALVHMSSAQLTKKGHQARIELSDRYGKTQWFIIPLKDRTYKAINAVYPADLKKLEHDLLNTLMSLYGKAPFYAQVMEQVVRPALDEYLGGADHSLAAMNIQFTEKVLNMLEAAGAIVPTTHHDYVVTPDRPEDPSEWIAEMGHAIGAEIYLGGGTAQKAYLQEEHFKEREMSFWPQNYKMPPYLRDRKTGTLVANAMVCILEPLFCIGPEATLQLLYASANQSV